MEMTLYIIASFVLGALIVFGPCYLIIWLFHKSQSNKYANNTKDVIPLEEQYPEARKISCAVCGVKLYEIPVSEWTAEKLNYWRIYEMTDKPELYDYKITEEVDKIIKNWQNAPEEAKKVADFNNLATEYFSE